MKTFSLLLVLVLSVCAPHAWAEDGEIQIDMATGIKATFHKDVGAKIEVANEGQDNIPTLTVQIPSEGAFERYFGSVRLPITLPNPSPGDYAVIFEAKFEPGENNVEMRVFDFSKKQPVELGTRKELRMTADWKEFVYDFSVDGEGVLPTVTWTEMARKGKTLSLRNVRLVRY